MFTTQWSQNEKRTALLYSGERAVKFTTAADKNTYAGSASSLNIENAVLKININELSKQVYTTQWSEKWKKNVFHSLILIHVNDVASCQLVHQNICTFIGSWSHMISSLFSLSLSYTTFSLEYSKIFLHTQHSCTSALLMLLPCQPCVFAQLTRWQLIILLLIGCCFDQHVLECLQVCFNRFFWPLHYMESWYKC